MLPRLVPSSPPGSAMALAATLGLLLVCIIGSLPQVAGRNVTVCEYGCEWDYFDGGFGNLTDGDTLVLIGPTTFNPDGFRNLTYNVTFWGMDNCSIHASSAWLTILPNVSLKLKGAIGFVNTGILLSDGARVEQEGDVTFLVGDAESGAPSIYTGLTLLGAAQWSQQGPLRFIVNATILGSSLQGISVGAQSRWVQGSTVEFEVEGHQGVATGAVLSPTASLWTSSGDVSVWASGVLATGLDFSGGSNTWSTTGHLTVESANGALGASFANVTWTQQGEAEVSATDEAMGLRFGGLTNVWNQNAAFSLEARNNATGVLVAAPQQWSQNGIFSVNASSDAIGLDCQDVGLLTWTSSQVVVLTPNESGISIAGTCATPAASATPSPSPQILLSNMTTVQSMPMLCFNLSAPAVLILPKDPNGNVQQQAGVSVSLDSVSRTDANGTVLEEATVTDGMWGEEANNSLGASQSYVYACNLNFNSTSATTTSKRNGGSANTTVLQLQWYLFNTTTNVTLGEGLSFGITPAYTKLTVRLANWPWSSSDADGRAELRIAIDPPFTGSAPQSGSGGVVRAFGLSGQTTSYTAGTVATTVRLVDAVEIDGQVVSLNAADGRPPVEYWLDGAASQLVLSFGRFNKTLVYDPDFGVLVGGTENGGTSSDNLGLIIGVAVAVPLAVLLVLVVIGGAVGLTYYRRRHRNLAQDSINFGEGDAQL